MFMKKIIKLLLVLVIAAFALASCGGSEGGTDSSGSADIDSLKTLGDVIALEKEDTQTSVGSGKAVYAFKYGDKYYRVIADISGDVEQAYMDVDIVKEGYEDKQNEILAPIEITSIEDLNEQILSQDDLDALAGKTGQELVDDGWTYQGSYMLDSMEVYMCYGPFQYIVVFDGSVEGGDQDDFDIQAATKDLKVKSAEFSSLGDATEIEDDSE
jgi:hypothetical protein